MSERSISGMPQLRFLIATSRFWPLAGDEPTHLLRLSESLLAAGHRVTILTAQWKRSWPRQMMVSAVPLIRLPGAPHGGWSTLRWMHALSSALREPSIEPPDVVLVAGLRYEAYVALGAARRTNLPVILLANEGDVAWSETALLGGRVAARCRRANAIVAPSRELAGLLANAGYSERAISVIPRAVPIVAPRSPQPRAQIRAALAAANHDLVTTETAPVALAVGRLDGAHGFGDLIRAWRIVTARRSEARLWIVGDGPDRERLYRQISDLDQRFRVLIPGTFDCLDELFQAADMLLVPGPHTVPPLAMLDAQAAGLPVVAADAPALRQSVVPEQTGLLFPVGDAKALAEAIWKLIDDPATAVALGAAGRQESRAATTPQQEAAAYLSLARNLLSPASSR